MLGCFFGCAGDDDDDDAADVNAGDAGDGNIHQTTAAYGGVGGGIDNCDAADADAADADNNANDDGWQRAMGVYSGLS